jgi:hypothetical protein
MTPVLAAWLVRQAIVTVRDRTGLRDKFGRLGRNWWRLPISDIRWGGGKKLPVFPAFAK